MKWFKNNKTLKELLFQLVFLMILFFFYSFDKHRPDFEWYMLGFFLYYTVAASFISYVLIPKYFYKYHYFKFYLGLILVFVVSYFMEEFVLEQLFFDDKRAHHISNFFYTLLEIFPIIFIMVSFKMAWDAIQKHGQIETLQHTVQESELRFLKSQINPHFLFNNLNNLYAYAIENSPKTPTIILELASVLRYMLYDCKENFVPLSKEIEHIKHFTALNELHIETRGKVSFSAATKSETFYIAPLILSMFIENAFKHSSASQTDNINIDVTLTVDDNGLLQFGCENSFLPNANNDHLSKGIGLENVKKRLHLLYPKAHHLLITSQNNIYKVTLELQLKSHRTTYA
ncbi:MAG: histidine kinase [Flavobacteriaceae bacterium]|nr:histidine kinase [Flavobacteriaceae bacterium]